MCLTLGSCYGCSMQPQPSIGSHQAIILAADVAGQQNHAAGTLGIIEQEVVVPAITRHGGQVMRGLQEGMLAEFPSAPQAVTCAVEIQEALERRHMVRPSVGRMRLQIGIHSGEVTLDRGDIQGDAVAVASKIEEMDHPGGICISQTVMEAVKGTTPFVYESVGVQQLQSIEKPMAVYHLVAETEVRVQPATPLLRHPLILSALVVLILFSAWWTWTMFAGAA